MKRSNRSRNRHGNRNHVITCDSHLKTTLRVIREFFSMNACVGVRIKKGKAAFVRAVQKVPISYLTLSFLDKLTRHLRRHKILVRRRWRRKGWLPFLSPCYHVNLRTSTEAVNNAHLIATLLLARYDGVSWFWLTEPPFLFFTVRNGLGGGARGKNAFFLSRPPDPFSWWKQDGDQSTENLYAKLRR